MRNPRYALLFTVAIALFLPVCSLSEVYVYEVEELMATNAIIGAPNYVLGGSGVVVSGGATEPTLPVANLTDKSPSKFARWTNKDPNVTFVAVDLGEERNVGAVALVMVGGEGAAVNSDDQWRVRMGPSPAASLNPVAPSSIESQVNLTGSLTDIDENPDAGDALWMTATNSAIDTDIRVQFPTPASTTEGPDFQEFRILVRGFNDGTATVLAKLYQNGNQLLEFLDTPTVTTEEVLSFRWDSALLTGLANVELRITSRVTPNVPVEIGAIRWNQVLILVAGTDDSGMKPVPYSVADPLWGDSLLTEVGPLSNPVLVYIPATPQTTVRYVRFDIRLGKLTNQLDIGAVVVVPTFSPSSANISRATPFAGVEYLAKPTKTMGGRVVIGSVQPPKRLLKVEMPYLTQDEYQSLYQRLFLSGQRTPVLVSITPDDDSSHQISTVWAEVVNDGRSFPAHHLVSAKDGFWTLTFTAEEIK